MDSRTKIIASSLVLGLVIIGIIVYGVILLNEAPSPGSQPESPPAATSSESSEITYGSSGFSPNKLTVTAGTTVTFLNQTELPMWVASDPHPAHTSYPELDTSTLYQNDVPPANQSYSFKFEKRGTWTYHNHSRPEHAATITVQ